MEEHRNPRRSRRLAYQRARLQQGLLMSVILLGTILCLTLGSLLTPDRTYSDSENRKLAQFPKLSWSAVKDGSWFSDLESYTADQFAGRDFWIALRLRFLKLTGQKESNGVYLCSGDYLMEPPADPPQDSRNVEAINAFAARHTDLRLNMAVIPNAACILADKLPKNAPVRDQSADLTALAGSLQGISFLDVSAALSAHTDEQLYYRTDHHWTSLGARYAFEAMAAQLGISQPIQNYDTYTVSTTFEGTLASRSGSHAAYDTVELYVPQTDVEYYVSYGDAAETSATIYAAARWTRRTNTPCSSAATTPAWTSIRRPKPARRCCCSRTPMPTASCSSSIPITTTSSSSIRGIIMTMSSPSSPASRSRTCCSSITQIPILRIPHWPMC